jgi:two-component system capsular synthesis sensor histidine kinase RcsC
LNRYQRTFLHSAGIVISIILAALTGVVLYSTFKDYVTECFADFVVHKTRLEVELERRVRLIRTASLNEEAVWETRQPQSKSLVERFAAQNGRVLLQESTSFNSMLAMGDITPQHSWSAFSPYLGLALEFNYRLGAYAKARERTARGFLYSPDRNFVMVIPAPENNDPLKRSGAKTAHELLHRIAPDIGDLA